MGMNIDPSGPLAAEALRLGNELYAIIQEPLAADAPREVQEAWLDERIKNATFMACSIMQSFASSLPETPEA